MNNCQVAKDIKCQCCNASSQVAAACLPTASVRAVEGEGGQGQNTLALEYQPNKQQQEQPKQAVHINYVQTFPELQLSYPNREAGRYYSPPQQQGGTANINTITKAYLYRGESREERSMQEEKSRFMGT